MPKSPERLEITISWRTLLKVFVACLLVYLAVRLWRLAELLLLALLIAVALRPLIQWTRRHRWPRWAGVLLSALILLGSTAAFLVILVPTIATEGTAFLERLPALRDQLLSQLPASGAIRGFLTQLLNSPALSNPEPMVKHLAAWGGTVLTSLVGVCVVLIVAVYFIADGERVYKWCLAFLPEAQRAKVAVAGEEIAAVVGHYMVGQVITSVLCGIYAFAVLMVFRVPSAALLAVLAGLFDVLPLIGFFLFAIPAVAMAFTVSPMTAVLVAALYVAYHLLENYFIVPKIYGNRLKISTLTVLVACLAAGLVGGVVGVILVLPMVASYPILERVWLQPYLQRGTVQKHEQIIADEHPEK